MRAGNRLELCPVSMSHIAENSIGKTLREEFSPVRSPDEGEV